MSSLSRADFATGGDAGGGRKGTIGSKPGGAEVGEGGRGATGVAGLTEVFPRELTLILGTTGGGLGAGTLNLGSWILGITGFVARDLCTGGGGTGTSGGVDVTGASLAGDFSSG